MSLLFAFAVAQAAYDAVVESVDYSGGKASIRGRATEFPDGSILNLQVTRAIETLDWRTSTFTPAEPPSHLAREAVTLTRNVFTWDAPVPGPGRYVLHVLFQPDNQRDPAVKRAMLREFHPYSFDVPITIGRARDVFAQAERDLKAIDDARDRLGKLAAQVDEALKDREGFSKKQTALIKAIDEEQAKFDPSRASAVLSASADGVFALRVAVQQFVVTPPNAEGMMIAQPMFSPSGEVITLARAPAILKEMEPFLLREAALAAFREIRLQADGCARLREQMKAKPVRTTIAARGKAMHEELDAAAAFMERLAVGDRGAALEPLVKVKEPELTLANVRDATDHLINSTESFLTDGQPAEADYAAEAGEVAKKLDLIETKLRTGLDPKKEKPEKKP